MALFPFMTHYLTRLTFHLYFSISIYLKMFKPSYLAGVEAQEDSGGKDKQELN